MNGNGQQQKMPHWLASCFDRVVDIWSVGYQAQPISGFFAHAGDGFIELVQREEAAYPAKYTHTFVHIQHICRIAPAAAQWRPNAGLAVPEKPKLVVP